MQSFARQLSILRRSPAPRLILAAVLPLLAGSAFAQVSSPAPSQLAFPGEGQAPSDIPTGPQFVLRGHTPHQVLDGTALHLSHYGPEQKLRLAIGVQPPDMAGEEALIREQQTKGSPNFHKFLTAEEWNTRFAPSAEDEQKVVDWATSQGLTVTQRFANRLLVDVEAPAAVIEKAFAVTIDNYQVGDEVDFSADRDPSIPSHLYNIVSCVMGLNSIQRAHPATERSGSIHKGPDYMAGPVYTQLRSSSGDGDPSKAPWNQATKPAQNQAAATGTTPSGEAYDLANGDGVASPQDIFSSEAYNYAGLYAQGHCCNVHNDTNGSPADTSIALMTMGDFIQDDANTFFKAYGLAWNVDTYIVDGSVTPGTECKKGASGCTTPPGQDDEADLDVEISTAFSNSFDSSNDTAHVYVYEAANGNYNTIADIYNFIVSDNHAHVVSTSYGWGEDTWSPESFITGTATGQMHGIFNSMVGQGWTLISASGDHGPTQDCSNKDVVLWPASDPDFLAAGGTSLHLNSDDTFDYEVAWTGGTTAKDCGSNGGGGGGGQSVFFTQPYWQNGLGGTGRLLPDISLEAGFPTAQWDYCTTAGCKNDNVDGWGAWGGTSIVAPELAGFFAQSNAYLNAIGHICGSNGTSACEPIGDPGWIIYGEAMKPTAQHYPFYDIVKGCTTNFYTTAPNDAGYFCSVPGYDESTGWGSANMLQLAWAINWEVIPSSGKPTVTWSGPAKNTWYNTNQTVSWTIHDAVPTGSTPGSGIAGETQGWDSIPSDPGKEATPGSGNSFYSGPQFPNSGTGCLSFVAGSCSGGVTQGCHTAYARGWNNQGTSTAGQTGYPETYGPICYDTVDPTVALSTSPVTSSGVWVKTPEKITLAATDPGGSGASGIAKTYYGNAYCFSTQLSLCTAYTGAFTIATEGSTEVSYFTEDNAGNFSSLATFAVNVDLTAPVTTDTLSGTLSGTNYISAATVTLSATDNLSGVSNTHYFVDGGANTIYTSPIVVSTPGTHKISFYSVDVAGNQEATKSVSVTIVSALTVSPGSLTFTSTAVGTSSAAQIVTLTNASNSAVSFTAATTITGPGASSFIKSASTCTNPLPAGASCTNSIEFKPTTTGALSAVVTYTDSGSPTPQTVSLTGTGAAAGSGLTFSPSSLTFASTAIGSTATQTITLTNNSSSPVTFTAATTITGSGAASFAKIASTCMNPLPAGASCTNTIQFKPTASGTLTAVVTYSDSASGSPQTVPLTGTGAASGSGLAISPGSLTFASTAVGTAAPTQLITLTNTSASPVTFTASTTITGSGAASFTKSASTCTNPLPAGASCTNTIEFKPTVSGALTALVTYTDSGSASPQTVTLSGTGASAGSGLAISPGSLSFTSTAIGTAAPTQFITLTNNSSAPVTFTAATTITGSGAGSFAKTASTCVNPLPVGASCTNTIQFKPTASGALAAVVTYTDSASASPQTVSLAGTGQ